MTLFVGQLKDFFGLSIASVPSGFVDKVIAYATNISTINWTATAVGAAAIVIMLLWPKVTDKIPGSLIAIIVTTAVVYFAIPSAVSTESFLPPSRPRMFRHCP